MGFLWFSPTVQQQAVRLAGESKVARRCEARVSGVKSGMLIVVGQYKLPDDIT